MVERNGLLSTGTIVANNVSPIGSIETVEGTPKIKLTQAEVKGCDIALSQYSDLMHPRFYAWYCKAFYAIGRERFHQLAAMARVDGRDKPKYFSALIRNELAK